MQDDASVSQFHKRHFFSKARQDLSQFSLAHLLLFWRGRGNPHALASLRESSTEANQGNSKFPPARPPATALPHGTFSAAAKVRKAVGV